MLEKELLTRGSNLWVYNPTIDFFIDKVNKSSPFSWVKQNHAIFEYILRYIGSNIGQYSHEEVINRCSKRFIKEPSMLGTPLEAQSTALKDFLYLMSNSNNLPPNFLLGISERGFGRSSGIDSLCHSMHRTPVKDMVKIIKFFLPPKDAELYRGTIWKDYYLNNSLTSFLEAIKNKNVLYFGSSCDHPPPILNKFKFIKISHTAACTQYDYMKKRIREAHNSIIFFCAGQAQCHVIKEMHLVNNNTLIDCGQALLPYILNSYHGRWARAGRHTPPKTEIK